MPVQTHLIAAVNANTPVEDKQLKSLTKPTHCKVHLAAAGRVFFVSHDLDGQPSCCEVQLYIFLSSFRLLKEEMHFQKGLQTRVATLSNITYIGIILQSL